MKTLQFTAQMLKKDNTDLFNEDIEVINNLMAEASSSYNTSITVCRNLTDLTKKELIKNGFKVTQKKPLTFPRTYTISWR